jgi:ribosomal-protein-serine acetyltransferase
MSKGREALFSSVLDDRADLRPLEPHHAPEFLALIERERTHFGEWLPWGADIDSEDKARAFLQRLADRQAADQGRGYAIWLDGEMVGGVLFRTFDVKTGNCEIGVWLAAHATGRGIMTKACSAMIDWAFHERNMFRVEWHAASGNLPSLRVAQRLGMHRDGVLRQAFLYRDVRHDEEVWSLLASDQRPTQTNDSDEPNPTQTNQSPDEESPTT